MIALVRGRERRLGRRNRRALRDPEVEHLHGDRAIGAPREEEVRRLEIAVHDPGSVRLGDRLARFEHVAHGLVERQRGELFEVRREVAATRGTP